MLLVRRAEIICTTQYKSKSTITCQAVYRGWLARRRCYKLREARKAVRVLEKKQRIDAARSRGAQQKVLREKLKSAYLLERAQEFTARVVGFVKPATFEKQKMAQFGESAYCADDGKISAGQLAKEVLDFEAFHEERDQESRRELCIAEERRDAVGPALKMCEALAPRTREHASR